MNHSEHDFINIGYRYERSKITHVARSIAYRIHKMLLGESISDQSEARRLIERGRSEARSVRK